MREANVARLAQAPERAATDYDPKTRNRSLVRRKPSCSASPAHALHPCSISDEVHYWCPPSRPGFLIYYSGIPMLHAVP